jgi:hypothetical protein
MTMLSFVRNLAGYVAVIGTVYVWTLFGYALGM